MENLFKFLKKKKSGCWINHIFLGMFGYSDDNFALAPSIHALRDMLKTISDYAEEHNLRFSTNPNPKKCKTKVMAFMKKPRILPDIYLGPAKLPWVDNCIHLGNNLKNVIDGCQEDMKIKSARYVSKNIELNQEFYFSHPETKIGINKIWNTHFTGRNLWNLFTEGAVKVKFCYNSSQKYMMYLPYATHRFLIEPLSNEKHIMFVLIERFISFMEIIEKSRKQAIKMLKSEASKDVRSTTGSNYRGFMMILCDMNVGSVTIQSIRNLEYRPVSDNDQWKVILAKELYDVLNGNTALEGFDLTEVEDMMDRVDLKTKIMRYQSSSDEI